MKAVRVLTLILTLYSDILSKSSTDLNIINIVRLLTLILTLYSDILSKSSTDLNIIQIVNEVVFSFLWPHLGLTVNVNGLLIRKEIIGVVLILDCHVHNINTGLIPSSSVESVIHYVNLGHLLG